MVSGYGFLFLFLQGYILCVEDYNFAILNNAFLIHKPGIKTQKDNRRATNGKKVGAQNSLIRSKILPELKVLFGQRKGCTVWYKRKTGGVDIWCEWKTMWYVVKITFWGILQCCLKMALLAFKLVAKLNRDYELSMNTLGYFRPMTKLWYYANVSLFKAYKHTVLDVI